MEVCEQYDEVTIALLDEKVQGAYTYLQKRDYDWIRSRVVFENERRFRLEHEKLLLTKLREIIAAFDSEGYPERVLSYGYIANLLGVTRDELRYKMSPNSELRAFLNEIVEHKATWRQERIARMRTTNIGQECITRKRIPKVVQSYTEYHSRSCSERENPLLSKLREVIAKFEVEGYPDKQLSYGLLADLAGSTQNELLNQMSFDSALQTFLKDIVEHRSIWRQERAAKIGEHRSKREKILQNAIEQIKKNPPKERISYKYIAKMSGLSRYVLEDSPHFSTILNDIVESKETWYKRRLITAFHSKSIDGRTYSTFEILSLNKSPCKWK